MKPTAEKSLPDPKDRGTSSSRPRKPSATKKQDPGRMILGTGNLCPANTGMYGVVSQVEVKKGLERVASQQVLVETIEEDSGDKSKDMGENAKAMDRAITDEPDKQEDAPPACIAPIVFSPNSKRHSADDRTREVLVRYPFRLILVN